MKRKRDGVIGGGRVLLMALLPTLMMIAMILIQPLDGVVGG